MSFTLTDYNYLAFLLVNKEQCDTTLYMYLANGQTFEGKSWLIKPKRNLLFLAKLAPIKIISDLDIVSPLRYDQWCRLKQFFLNLVFHYSR